MSLLKDIFNYWEFLKTNVKKDIRGKYKGSFLGVLWSFINPLLSVVVYAIVFQYIMRFNIEHYLIYLISGIIPWTFFTTALNSGINSILYNANIIKKVYFPRSILPISSVTSALINFLISCIIILLFTILSGIGISINLIYLPLVIIIQYILCLGIVFILSAVEIYVKDIEHIINFFISMLFYVTPILYTSDAVPDNMQFLLKSNPMSYIIESYHNIFYYKHSPDLYKLGVVFLISVIIFIFGYNIFKKLQKGFAEEV